MSKNDVLLSKDIIDDIFNNATDQGSALIALYKCVIPLWDKIAKLHDFPKCNDYTWKYICKKFQELDHKYHPNVLAGGCWMNSGFSVENHLPDFLIESCEKIQYKGDKNPIEKIFINYAYTGNVRLCFSRRFTSHNYTVKHMSQFHKYLISLGYKLTRMPTNNRVWYYSM